jgi:uncharacterized membrane protein YsdA (DUF1294 family)/cold shock CspA family protein
MRHSGQIATWKDDRGFGFIAPRGGGEQVFVHIKSFSVGQRRPSGGEFVTYELTSDDQGRLRAERVAYVADRPTTPARSGTVWVALSALFLACVAALVGVGKLPLAVLGLYLVASLTAFLAYALDKKAAQTGRWRTRESPLHLLALIGGWPGALVAQAVLRHKSKKLSFRIVFWATVVLNCLGLCWLLTPNGSETLRSLLQRLSDQ